MVASAPALLVTRQLPRSAMDALESAFLVTSWSGDGAIPREWFLAEAAGKAGLVTLLTDRVDDELLDAAGPQLRVVANYAVGVDNVDLEACTRRAVMVTNTPDVLTEATADMAFALLMAAARRVAEGDRFLRARPEWTWGPEMMLGQDVSGSTLGIVGLGRIGRAMARRGLGFGMRVLASGTRAGEGPGARALGGGALGGGAPGAGALAELVGFERLLAESDFVSLHVSLNGSTHHLIDAEALSLMKPTAVLVNTARGAVVDEAALAEALSAGRLFAAGLDVFEEEPAVHPGLLVNPRVVLTPHLGSATVRARDAMGQAVVHNVLAALDGRRPPALVNAEVLGR